MIWKRPPKLKKLNRDDYRNLVLEKAATLNDASILKKIRIKGQKSRGRLVVSGVVLYSKLPSGLQVNIDQDYSVEEVLDLWISVASLQKLESFLC